MIETEWIINSDHYCSYKNDTNLIFLTKTNFKEFVDKFFSKNFQTEIEGKLNYSGLCKIESRDES